MRPVRAPALVIRVELEQPVRVYTIWDDEHDEDRLVDWVGHRPDIARLVEDALALANRTGLEEEVA